MKTRTRRIILMVATTAGIAAASAATAAPSFAGVMVNHCEPLTD